MKECPLRVHCSTPGPCCRSYICVFDACHSCSGLPRTKRNSMGAIKNWKHSNSMDSPNCLRKSRLTVQPNDPHNFSIMARSVILGVHDGETVTVGVNPQRMRLGVDDDL